MKRLDLRKDFADVFSFVADRVRSFDSATNDGPGEVAPIMRIDIGFGLYQSGWVALVFDTRPGPEPDGEWDEHIEGNDLERPHWSEACDINDEAPLALLMPDGTRRELPSGACSSGQLATAIGEMLRGVLLKARADGLFARLPKAARCELGVEEQEGSHGWPEYQSRGADNLA